MLLSVWIMVIFVYQFHQKTSEKIKKNNFLGLIPNFHLFSPRPFLGIYVIRYSIRDRARSIDIKEEFNYIGGVEFWGANRRIVKCLNTICRYLPGQNLINTNYRLLLTFVKNEARKKAYTGKIRFYIYVLANGQEKLLLKSRSHAL